MKPTGTDKNRHCLRCLFLLLLLTSLLACSASKPNIQGKVGGYFQLFEGEAVCKLVDDALKCETDNGQINLKKL